ncbi:MAG: tyrosine-type recombinase/integrase [Dermatophilaceae bacterium]
MARPIPVRGKGAGGMSVAKRPDGRWRARFRDASGREHAKHFTRKVDAERWLTANMAQRDRGDWLDPERGRATVGELAPTWLASKQLKPTSVKSYESLWRTVAKPRWATTPVRDVTYTAVVQWVARLIDGGMSASRSGQALLVLKQILDLAVLDGRLSRNVAKQVSAPRTRPAKQRYLTHEQVHRLASECGRRHDRYRTLILLLAYTGLRWGEARALRRRHLDPDTGLLQIVDNIPTGYSAKDTGSPKSNRARVVPLPGFLRNDIEALAAHLEPEVLLFATSAGTLLNASNFRRDAFDPAVQRLGLNPLTPHDLRHTAASLAISAGASVVGVQTMLGHATPAITLSVYTHLFPADLQGVADRLDRAARRVRERSSTGPTADPDSPQTVRTRTRNTTKRRPRPTTGSRRSRRSERVSANNAQQR